MASVPVDFSKVREFRNAGSFYRWLARHHDKEDELWIKIHKVGSGLPSVTAKEAIDVALCWGWIDGIRKGLDEQSFLQRYTPRRKRSVWSLVNVENVARLIREGRMTEHGLREVEAAKADGRWECAYRANQNMPVPEDLQAAIDVEPQAKATFDQLNARNRLALVLRTIGMKTAAGRKRKIETFVEMLKRGETFYGQGPPR